MKMKSPHFDPLSRPLEETAEECEAIAKWNTAKKTHREISHGV